MASFFTSCKFQVGSEGNNADASIAVGESFPENVDETPEEQGIYTYADLGGYTYQAYVYGSGSGSSVMVCEDFWTEDPSGDYLKYAVYARNTYIENTYHCKISQVDSKDLSTYNELKKFYLNGEQYELCIIPTMDAAACATSALLCNVYELENIKLQNTAYDQNSIGQLAVGGKLYYLSGDMNVSMMDAAAVTCFNSALYREYDFEKKIGDGKAAYNDPYQMVHDGTWTLENMLKIAAEVDHDRDKSGTLDATVGDKVGFFQHNSTPLFYWFGLGARLTENDPKNGGYPAIAFDSDKGEDTFALLYDNLNTAVEHPERAIGGGGDRKESFKTGNILFFDIILWDVRKVYRPAEYEYGILPLPKADVDQTRYFDIVYNPSRVERIWAIPTTCANRDYASFLLNVIAVYSARSESTMDVYFRITLSTASQNDTHAYATLHTVRNSLTYDYCLLYDWGDFITEQLSKLSTSSFNTYADATAKEMLDLANAEMNRTLKGFKVPTPPVPEKE